MNEGSKFSDKNAVMRFVEGTCTRLLSGDAEEWEYRVGLISSLLLIAHQLEELLELIHDLSQEWKGFVANYFIEEP